MKTNYILALIALLGGLFAAFTSHSEKNHLYPTWKFEKARIEGVGVRFISPHHLADLLYQKQELTLLDVRGWSDYQSYHIPTALHFYTEEKLEKSRTAGRIILYGSEDEEGIYELARDLPGKVYVLKGGLEAWYSLVLFPDMLEYRVRNSDQLLELVRRCGFFGGQARNTQVLNLNVRESRYREGC